MEKHRPYQFVSVAGIVTGFVPFIVALTLLVAGALLLSACGSGDALPTRVPTAAVIDIEEPTAAPTLTPTPPPLTVTISAPADGTSIDLGQSVELVVFASDPVGIQRVILTSNGQSIGIHEALDQTTMDINQEWTPNYAGTHQVIAAVTNRAGETVESEPISIQVVDRELLARNAPIWAEVEGNVTEMRGLAALEPVQPILLSRTELRQRLQAEFFFSKKEARREVLVLSVFDFVPRNFDLYHLSRRYLGENIGGYYDPATKEFVVVSDDDEVDALEQWIHAHEFMHALQDQHFRLDMLTDTSLGYEGGMAIRALAEGEASLVQNLYVEWGYFTREELAEIFNLTSRSRYPDADYLPPVLVNTFNFPYTTGLEFAQRLYRRNGWAGLNAAWQNPPRSTEQIIHSDRYLSGDTPQLVSLSPLTDTLGTGWIQLEEAVLGELYLREYLKQRLDAGEVNVAATGWGGDRFAVYGYEESDALVMVLRSVWDSARDSNQFAAAFTTYASRSYGQQMEAQADGGTCWQTVDVVCLYQPGAETLVVRAPDLETAVAVANASRQ